MLKGVNPIQPLRFELQEKGRFEPLPMAGWKNNFMLFARILAAERLVHSRTYIGIGIGILNL
jgi:hypothetical protein